MITRINSKLACINSLLTNPGTNGIWSNFLCQSSDLQTSLLLFSNLDLSTSSIWIFLLFSTLKSGIDLIFCGHGFGVGLPSINTFEHKKRRYKPTMHLLDYCRLYYGTVVVVCWENYDLQVPAKQGQHFHRLSVGQMSTSIDRRRGHDP